MDRLHAQANCDQVFFGGRPCEKGRGAGASRADATLCLKEYLWASPSFLVLKLSTASASSQNVFRPWAKLFGKSSGQGGKAASKNPLLSFQGVVVVNSIYFRQTDGRTDGRMDGRGGRARRPAGRPDKRPDRRCVFAGHSLICFGCFVLLFLFVCFFELCI